MSCRLIRHAGWYSDKASSINSNTTSWTSAKYEISYKLERTRLVDQAASSMVNKYWAFKEILPLTHSQLYSAMVQVLFPDLPVSTQLARMLLLPSTGLSACDFPAPSPEQSLLPSFSCLSPDQVYPGIHQTHRRLAVKLWPSNTQYM